MQKILAECEPNALDCVLLVMPHADSDWAAYLKESQDCVRNIAKAIALDTDCVIVLPPHAQGDVSAQQNMLGELAMHPRVHALFAPTNDTWARDFAPLCAQSGDSVMLLKYRFNAWGEKFESALDNKLALSLDAQGFWRCPLTQSELVLEGGSIESNGAGTLLTTTSCLLHKQRNPCLDKTQIESWLYAELGVQQILWLEHGYLKGDDTDCHIDNLARFIDSRTIVYIACEDVNDEHYESLQKMQDELRSFRDCAGNPCVLVALPFCEPLYYDGERLPASYANFLMLQNRILLPTFGSERDKEAQRILQQHSGREVVPVDCRVLLRQHGGLHCMSMQFVRGTIAFENLKRF